MNSWMHVVRSDVETSGVLMVDFFIEYPEGYDGFAWEHEVKGWIGGIVLFYDGKKFKLNFYSPERLAQEVSDELDASAVFYEPNLLVIPEVNARQIEIAVHHLIKTGGVRSLICDQTRKEEKQGSE
jgi:hypothetical protein